MDMWKACGPETLEALRHGNMRRFPEDGLTAGGTLPVFSQAAAERLAAGRLSRQPGHGFAAYVLWIRLDATRLAGLGGQAFPPGVLALAGTILDMTEPPLMGPVRVVSEFRQGRRLVWAGHQQLAG